MIISSSVRLNVVSRWKCAIGTSHKVSSSRLELLRRDGNTGRSGQRIGCSKSIHDHYNPIKPWNRKILREFRPHPSRPPVAITLRKRSIQARMVASHSSGVIELRISSTFPCNSSNDRPSQVCRRCFTVPKR
jgi:hypothetical protein